MSQVATQTEKRKCGGKTIFTKKDAQTAANFFIPRKGKRLSIYPCRYGNHWHLTHK